MTHYERLDAARDADFTALKKAFYRRAKQCHPDLFGNSAAKTEEFKLLVAAFDVLSDPDKRRLYDESLGGEEPKDRPGAAATAFSKFSVMDSDADDTLEELIVGNSVPEGTSMATLFLDLERTMVFMNFREAKCHFSQRRYREAGTLLRKAVCLAPGNILYRVYLARCLAVEGELSGAKSHYETALALGKRRIPVQRLDTVRRELDAVTRLKTPLWHRLKKLFSNEKRESRLSPEDEMIEQTNRAIERLAKAQELEGRRKLK